MTTEPTIFIVMGVSGCGKSTIGKLLAAAFDIPFFDGDDYHPEANVQKMSKGFPLNDQDRQGWLDRLNQLAREHMAHGAVIACSALKKTYRAKLIDSVERQMEFVYLDGTKKEILERLQQRKGHFMPAGLLDSQFETLEPPINAISVSITSKPEKIVLEIISQYGIKKP